jgi:uncharacterized membrane protein (UPF0127 family)
MIVKTVKIQSLRNSRWIAERCDVAESFLRRLQGLIGRTTLSPGQGLLLNPCNDIHMWMMSIPIDVVFIEKIANEEIRTGKIHEISNELPASPNFRVTSVRENLRPWKLLPTRDFRASQTLELPVGTIRRCEIQPGDELCIS